MKLVGIVGSVTPPGRLLNATRWLVENAQTSHADLHIDLINLADKRIAFADGRPPEQYQDDTAGIVRTVGEANAVIIASPIYRGSITGALKNLLDHLPLESLAGKPVGIVAMGATHHHFLGVDWHLRDILAWFGALVVPTSAYLLPGDFVDGELSENARQDLKDLADAAITLAQVAPKPGSFLGPRPLASRRS